ncbi:MAG: KpsF/GutQ family sugar-phosphate isomerase [Gammaproteobacteria bacterium]
MNESQLQKLATAVLEIESRAVGDLVKRIDATFVRACELMLDCPGRIVVTGMGKSGHIGNKIAATLASTGTPAFFVHPGEASHGDLGMVKAEDVVFALSNSGETDEVLTLLPLFKRLGLNLIAMTGNPKSTLARNAAVHLDVSVKEEACPLGLAPTASTTAALAMGDALAIALLDSRGFTPEDFARSHPAGSLGRRLLLHLDDVMHTGDAVPSVHEDASLRDALLEMTRKHLGMTAILNDQRKVVGIYTDGDLRRTLDHDTPTSNDTPIHQLMTPDCMTVNPHMLAVDALKLMETKKINGLLVVDADGCLVGALNMHDMLRAGLV